MTIKENQHACQNNHPLLIATLFFLFNLFFSTMVNAQELVKPLSEPINKDQFETQQPKDLEIKEAPLAVKDEQITENTQVVAVVKQQNTVKLDEITKLLDQQSKNIALLQDEIKNLNVELETIKVNKKTITEKPSTNIKANHYLQSAQFELESDGNIVKASILLKNAKNSLQENQKNTAEDIQQVINQLEVINQQIGPSLTQKLINLSIHASKLKAESVKKDVSITSKDENSAWYEKLVVIKKIDKPIENQEQQNPVNKSYSLLKHFDLISLAIKQKNQQQWQNTIDKTIALLQQDYLKSSQAIIKELDELKELNINPALPTLEGILTVLNQQPTDKAGN